MDHPTRPSATSAGKTGATGAPAQGTTPNSPFAGRPLDGSQYVEVIEEQEYADQRPSAEEQKPRYSYMKKQEMRDKK